MTDPTPTLEGDRVREWDPVRTGRPSAARWAAIAIGTGFVALGGIALARTGLSPVTGEIDSVWTFDFTALMAYVALGSGLLFLLAAPATVGIRPAVAVLGGLALAFGAVVALEPGLFDDAFGGGREVGYLYLGAGGLALLASWAGSAAARNRGGSV
jgi:hypothetical protein